MVRVQHNSPKKNRLIGTILAGKTIQEAAELNNIPHSTAKKIWGKYRATGTTSNRPRSGRPPKVTEKTRRLLVWTARKNRRTPLKDIGNQMEPKLSGPTVARHLALDGYHRRVGRKVPFLTKGQKRKRLMWARQQKGYDWSKVIWSDECYVYLDDTRGRVFVTRRADEEFDEDCLIPTFKQSDIRVMVWGCIMKGRKGPLVVLEYPGGKGGGMNAKRYQEQVLEGKLLEFWSEMNSERHDVVFQQDGAPSHTAKSTKKWLADHDIPIFPHPPSSPDLNPIERVWHELKSGIRSWPHHPTSVNKLITVVEAVWDGIMVEKIDKYVNCMDDVVDAVLAAKGGHTRF
jgi:transposase